MYRTLPAYIFSCAFHCFTFTAYTSVLCTVSDGLVFYLPVVSSFLLGTDGRDELPSSELLWSLGHSLLWPLSSQTQSRKMDGKATLLFSLNIDPTIVRFCWRWNVSFSTIGLIPLACRGNLKRVNTQLALQLPVPTASLKPHIAHKVLCGTALGFIFWKTRIFQSLMVSRNILQVLSRSYPDQQTGDICWLLFPF